MLAYLERRPFQRVWQRASERGGDDLDDVAPTSRRSRGRCSDPAAVAAGRHRSGNTARHRADALGLPGCANERRLQQRARDPAQAFHSIPPFISALIALPILAGMFWAAPLVSREYESGTHRLAWTQSVSPLRWITTKIVLIFGWQRRRDLVLALLAVWALNPLMPAFGGRFNSTWYDIQGMVPVACMLFALSVGLAASALIRRTIPAMAVTLAVYAVARIPIHFVRGHFWPPTTRTINVPLTDLVRNPIGSPADDFASGIGAGDWFLKGSVTDPSGHPIRANQNNVDILRRFCSDLGANQRDGGPLEPTRACQAKLQGLSLHEKITYQPEAHFWLVQGVECALFLLAAGLLVAVAIFAVTRRRPV